MPTAKHLTLGLASLNMLKVDLRQALLDNAHLLFSRWFLILSTTKS